VIISGTVVIISMTVVLPRIGIIVPAVISVIIIGRIVSGISPIPEWIVKEGVVNTKIERVVVAPG